MRQWRRNQYHIRFPHTAKGIPHSTASPPVESSPHQLCLDIVDQNSLLQILRIRVSLLPARTVNALNRLFHNKLHSNSVLIQLQSTGESTCSIRRLRKACPKPTNLPCTSKDFIEARILRNLKLYCRSAFRSRLAYIRTLAQHDLCSQPLVPLSR